MEGGVVVLLRGEWVDYSGVVASGVVTRQGLEASSGLLFMLFFCALVMYESSGLFVGIFAMNRVCCDSCMGWILCMMCVCVC